MSRSRMEVCVLTSVLWLIGVAQGGDHSSPIAVPDDPQTTILELEFQEPDAVGMAARVAIRGDGEISVSGGAQRGTRVIGRVTANELQELLQEIVRTRRILECDSDTIAAAVEQAGRRSGRDWRIRNAATTVIRVRLRDGEHEVRCPAAELLCERFPGIDELERLCAVQRRLQNVKAVAQAGGTAEAERLAKIAAAEWGDESGEEREVLVRHLLHVRDSGDGLRQFQFRVDAPADDGGSSGEAVAITIFETPQTLPRVSVTPLPARQ